MVLLSKHSNILYANVPMLPGWAIMEIIMYFYVSIIGEML